jgi:hypothetical protein
MANERIHELEDEIKQLKRRLDEVRQERDTERVLIAEMQEWLEDGQAQTEQWVDAFNMVQNDKGDWCWREGRIQDRDEGWEKFFDLRKRWNKVVGDYNAVVAPRRRNFGRPLAASETQRLKVLKLRDSDHSLRDIADETNLGLQTVRTIVDKRDWKDRGTVARLERIAPNRLAEAEERSRKRVRDGLPRRITEMHKSGAKLIKRAKGLR